MSEIENQLSKDEAKTTRPLSAAAKRALAEAKARHAAAKNNTAPNEVNGRGGLDPARYGDWEIKGITADF